MINSDLELSNKDAIRVEETAALNKIYNAKKKSLNLTQKELAVRYNVKPSSIYAYLKGETPLNPKFASFFAKQLECNVEDFSPRLAKAINAMASNIQIDVYHYPLLDDDQVENYAENCREFRAGALKSPSLVTNTDASTEGFWFEIKTEELQKESGASFIKGTKFLINPNLKPQVDQYVLISMNGVENSIIEAKKQIIVRRLQYDGVNIIATSDTKKSPELVLKNENSKVLGTVVAAVYPTEVFNIP